MDRIALSQGQRNWLIDALALWSKEGLVSPDQSVRILDRYETPVESSARQQSRAIFTLMSIAALLVGLAVLLVIGYNWEELPAAGKLVLIFGAILGMYALGFHLRYKRGAKALSEIAFFLGCFFYGSGIWLVAQIFHLNAHYPDGFWYWALGILPFAFCLDTSLLHTLLVVVLAAWVGTEILGFGDLGGWFFGRWRAIPNGAYSLPALALPGILWAYRKQSPLTLGLYVPLLAWWLMLQPFAWHLSANPVYFIGAVAGFLLLLAEAHPPGSAFAIPYRVFGVLVSAGVLIPLSYYQINTEMLRYGNGESGLAQTLAVTVLAGVVLLLGWLLARHSSTEPLEQHQSEVRTLRRQWLPCGLVGLMLLLSIIETGSRAGGFNGGPLLSTILVNVAMVGLAFWLLRVGLREDRSRPFAAGVLYFLLWTVLRYIDLFGGVGGMLGAALMFFLCGAALFGVAHFWRQRIEVRHV